MHHGMKADVGAAVIQSGRFGISDNIIFLCANNLYSISLKNLHTAGVREYCVCLRKIIQTTVYSQKNTSLLAQAPIHKHRERCLGLSCDTFSRLHFTCFASTEGAPEGCHVSKKRCLSKGLGYGLESGEMMNFQPPSSKTVCIESNSAPQLHSGQKDYCCLLMLEQCPY